MRENDVTYVIAHAYIRAISRRQGGVYSARAMEPTHIIVKGVLRLAAIVSSETNNASLLCMLFLRTRFSQ